MEKGNQDSLTGRARSIRTWTLSLVVGVLLLILAVAVGIPQALGTFVSDLFKPRLPDGVTVELPITELYAMPGVVEATGPGMIRVRSVGPLPGSAEESSVRTVYMTKGTAIRIQGEKKDSVAYEREVSAFNEELARLEKDESEAGRAALAALVYPDAYRLVEGSEGDLAEGRSVVVFSLSNILAEESFDASEVRVLPGQAQP